MIVGLSIIVPTINRQPGLANCLDSILIQATPLDELVVVFDGSDLDMEPTVERLQDATCDWKVARIEQLGAFGHGARNFALDNIVTRPRVLSIDDDDVYLSGAFALIRREVVKHPPAVHVFGARWGVGHEAYGTVLPRGRGLAPGEIATPMIVAPTCTARFGTGPCSAPILYDSGDGYFGDYDYASELAVIFGEFVWHEGADNVIAEIRPVVEAVPA